MDKLEKRICIGIVLLIVILAVFKIIVKPLAFESITPTEPIWLQYETYLRNIGQSVDTPTNTIQLPHLNAKQLRLGDTEVLKYMNLRNKGVIQLPDLYGSDSSSIGEEPAPYNGGIDTSAVYENVLPKLDNSSIVASNIDKTIGTNVADIGTTISNNAGEIGGILGYAGYNVDKDYTLLPPNLYNNLDDYKTLIPVRESPNLNSKMNNEDVLNKFPRTIIQKDFQGVSNIFAPNFIFLGNKEDYDIGFDNYLTQ